MQLDGDSGTDAPIHHLSVPLQPTEILQIASDLRAMMLPEIKMVVKEAVSEATQSLKNDIKDLRDGIIQLQNDNISLQAENIHLRKANRATEERLAAVEYDNDSLEQYSRRNSLRISGIPEDKDENTDQEVMRIAGSLGVDIGRGDIDKSHRVSNFDDHRRSGKGPGTKRRTRDVIVKFTTYNVRNKVYQERKELRNTETLKSVFINEDLTKKRSKLLFEARTLARADHLKAAYSSDGRIFVIDKEDK